jgi:hypothetical protein
MNFINYIMSQIQRIGDFWAEIQIMKEEFNYFKGSNFT